MTKKFTIFLLGMTLTAALCGCSSSTTDFVGEQNSQTASAQQSSPASVSDAQSSSASEQSSAASVESAQPSDTESSVSESTSEPSTVSESSAAAESSAASETPESSVSTITESALADESSEEPFVYVEPDDESSVDPQEASKFAARVYLNNGQIPINVADKNINASGINELNQALYIDNYQSFVKFYTDHKNAWSLDTVENGETFTQASAEFNESYFEDQCVIITLQQYEKGTDIEIGDVYKDGSGSVVTICKENAKSQASSAYILYLVTVQKSDLGGTKPTIEVVSAENYIENG